MRRKKISATYQGMDLNVNICQ